MFHGTRSKAHGCEARSRRVFTRVCASAATAHVQAERGRSQKAPPSPHAPRRRNRICLTASASPRLPDRVCLTASARCGSSLFLPLNRRRRHAAAPAPAPGLPRSAATAWTAAASPASSWLRGVVWLCPRLPLLLSVGLRVVSRKKSVTDVPECVRRTRLAISRGRAAWKWTGRVVAWAPCAPS